MILLRIAVALEVNPGDLTDDIGAESLPASRPAFTATEFITAREEARRR
jgi:hypothetical protein